MRRFWMLVTAVILMVGMIGGGTFAYFTSQAENTDNVFTSGTLIIGTSNQGPNVGTMTFGNAQPGDHYAYTINVNNLGSLPFWYAVTAQLASEDSELYQALVVSINGGIDQPLSSVAGLVLDLNLVAGAGEDVTFDIKLPRSAGNALQGKSCTIDFVFNAGQVNNAPANPNLVNAGFESGNLTGWTTLAASDSVAVVGADSFTSPLWGSKMLRLGDNVSPQPMGDNKVSQTFTVLAPTLTFAYNIFTYDYEGYDNFEYQVKVVAGGTVIDSFETTAWGSGTSLKTTGWQTVNLNLSGHLGQQVQIIISAGGTTDTTLPTWAYLDAPQ